MQAAIDNIYSPGATEHLLVLPLSIEILEYDDLRDRDQVIRLWREVFAYEASHNDPGLVIDKKLHIADGLFFIALSKK